MASFSVFPEGDNGEVAFLAIKGLITQQSPEIQESCKDLISDIKKLLTEAGDKETSLALAYLHAEWLWLENLRLRKSGVRK